MFTEEKDELICNYGLLKCGASEFGQLDVTDFIGYRKGQFQIEALVKNKKQIKKKYPDFLIDDVSIDEIMLFHVRGMNE